MKALLRAKLFWFFAVVLVLSVLYIWFFADGYQRLFFLPRNKNVTEGITIDSLAPSPGQDVVEEPIQIVVTNLAVPWEVVFLPDASMLITQRGGQVLKVAQSTNVFHEVPGVVANGEGGLLGMALHPNFDSNHWVYVYFTGRSDGNDLENRVERYTFYGESFSERKIIFSGIQGATTHDGGRIVFGPDGYLYVATGDAQQPDAAQDTTSLNGKILRIKDDGSVPLGNPFDSAVYSYGHRNVQGLAWNSKKELWATEHGPSGVGTGYDEINLINHGQNYGWPEIQGDASRAGMKTPVIQSGGSDTWAPSGMVFLGESLFFAGLRTVTVGPDGWLYVLTNNTDGRGDPAADDDKLVKINPQIFE